MKWVLIFYISFGHNAGGPATAEFNTREACEAAAELIKAEDEWGWAYCFGKG
jgi:hypothetical protein